MNEEDLKLVVSDFVKSGKPKYTKTFKLKGVDNEFYKVTFEKVIPVNVSESISLESMSNTISAYPSGAQCTRCKGSGRLL